MQRLENLQVRLLKVSQKVYRSADLLLGFLEEFHTYCSYSFRCKSFVTVKVLVSAIGGWKLFLKRDKREFSFSLKVPAAKIDYCSLLWEQ